MLDIPRFGVYNGVMQGKQDKQCYRCGKFERLYVKGIKKYSATKYGFCREMESNVQIHERCENFAPKQRYKKSNRTVLVCLNDLLAELSEVRKVLEEERGEQNV